MGTVEVIVSHPEHGSLPSTHPPFAGSPAPGHGWAPPGPAQPHTGAVPPAGHYPPAAGAYYPPPGPQPPYPGAAGPGPQRWVAPAEQLRTHYASWGRRALGWMIDSIPNLVFLVVYYIALIVTMVKMFSTRVPRNPLLAVREAPGWWIATLVLYLAVLATSIANRWILQGRTGQTIGRRVLKTKLIGEATGQPIGAGRCFLRDLAHVADGAAYVGYLWPLWDKKRQTFADMLLKDIVIDLRPEELRQPAVQPGPLGTGRHG